MRGTFEQFAASLASIFGALGIAGVLFVAAWAVAKWLGRVGRPDLRAYDATPWGEIVEVPDAAKSGGRRRAAPGSHKGHEIAPHSERGL